MSGAAPKGIRLFVVHPDKLNLYLLNLSHPHGESKAARLLRHKFDAATLAPILIEQAVKASTSRRGIPLEEPGWRSPNRSRPPLNTYLDVVTVWQVRPDEPTTADFITLIFL